MWSRSFWPHLPHIWRLLQAFLWWSYLWHLKHLRCWDILFYPLNAIFDIYFLGYFGQTENQNLYICLNFLLAFSDDYSFVVYVSLFSLGCSYFFWCSQGQLPTPNNSFWGIPFFIWIGVAFYSIESLHFKDIFGMPSAVHLTTKIVISFFKF